MGMQAQGPASLPASVDAEEVGRYEAIVARAEAILAQLERGGLPLGEALSRWREAGQLLDRAEAILQAVRQDAEGLGREGEG